MTTPFSHPALAYRSVTLDVNGEGFDARVALERACRVSGCLSLCVLLQSLIPSTEGVGIRYLDCQPNWRFHQCMEYAQDSEVSSAHTC